MPVTRIGLGLLVIVLVGTVFGWKAWEKHAASSSPLTAQVQGPAVILFRGDNSPGCRAIHRLVDQAAARYGDRIDFVQLDWSAADPLIKQFEIRFLPTVVFVDRDDQEVGRIVGESPAVQQKLGQALDRLDALGGS